nr:integrase, catalytic region, zinc finger, CCHC-type, peptidase aspartic, catalytic [Tanacetum cinerariifolium]
MDDLLDDNNFFIFDDESVRISPVSKMPFRKKPHDSMNVRSKSNSNKSLPRTVRLPKMKFEKDHLCSACEQGKIHRKHHKSKTAFASNKPLYLLHMNLYDSMRVQSINGKRYVLVVVDDYSRYTWVFFLHSKDEASEVIISFIKKTQVNLQLQVQRIRTDNGTEFKNKTLAKFFDETKDHPLHKIIGDPKLSVRTRGQIANSCLLSPIEPANVAEALRDADWVN